MKVVHIISGLNQGGAEASLYRLVTGSHDIVKYTVISLTDEGYYGQKFSELGVDVRYLRLKGFMSGIFGIFVLYRLLKKLSPDIVQTWMYHADIIGGGVARLAGIDGVCWGIRHSTLDASHSSLSSRVSARLSSVVSNWLPAAIVSCSERAMIVHQSLGYDARKFFIIPNGYDFEKFGPSEKQRHIVRQEFSVTEGEILIGYVARWNPQKDHATLFAAIRELRRKEVTCKCLLVGRDITYENTELGVLIRQHDLQDSIILAGPRDDIPAIMNALDIHVLSSSFGEAFPNVVAEAIACGTPNIVTDVGDAALIVGDKDLVVPPGEPLALAKAIIRLLDLLNQNGREYVIRKALKRVKENFSIKCMINAYIKVWKSVNPGRAKSYPLPPG